MLYYCGVYAEVFMYWMACNKDQNLPKDEHLRGESNVTSLHARTDANPSMAQNWSLFNQGRGGYDVLLL